MHESNTSSQAFVNSFEHVPDEETMQWVRDTLGPFELVSEFAHSHGYSRLWRISNGSDHAWLKMHAHARKWSGEVHALRFWTPPLGLAPNLIAYRDEPRAVLLSEVPGFPAEEVSVSSAVEEAMWTEAGVWLARLHRNKNNWLGELTVDGDSTGSPSTDPEGFVEAPILRRIRDGREMGLLSSSEIDFVEGFLKENLPCLHEAEACAIHRDYTPRNWMASAEGVLTSIIDFEHARWDVAAADLNRPWDYEFLRNPRLANAFYDGYGTPDARLLAQIAVLRLSNATTGVVWAVQVNDLPFSDRNRAALHRMMAEGCTPKI